MRISVVRAWVRVVAAVGVPAVFSCAAAATPITATISFVGTGTLGTTAFTEGLVTVSASFTSESLLHCGTGLDECSYPDGPPLFNQDAPVITVSVPGASGTAHGDVGVSVVPGALNIGDIEGRLYFDTLTPAITATSFLQPFGPVTGTYDEDQLGENCPPETPWYCPVQFYTSAGSLVLDSIDGTSTASVAVGGGSAATPEPGAWVLVGTGLLGGAGAVRRRLGR